MNARIRRYLLLLCLFPLAAHSFLVSTNDAGAEIKWTVRSMSLRINSAGAPSGTDTAIQSAMNTWSTVAGSDFDFVYAGSTSLSGAARNYANVCSFGNLPAGTIARNSFWFNSTSGAMLESDIVFNTDYSWSVSGEAGKKDVQNIATHELGHSLSLDDLYNASVDSEKTMYGYTLSGETKKRTLDPDDIAGILHLYPNSSYTVTFDAQGGAVSPASITVTSGTMYGTLLTPTRIGYTFGGWWTATNGAGSQVTSTTTVLRVSAQTLYAKWGEIRYTLTVIGGIGGGSYTNGQKVAVKAIVPRGMKFVDWNDGNTNASRIITMSLAPVTYTANFIDLQKPTVAIAYPARALRVVTNRTIFIRGTAADNGTLNGVMCQLYTGEWTNAVTTNGWKNWTAEYSPVPGLNTTRVYSVDVQGNVSSTSTVVFTYAPGAIMTVQTNGAGTFSPAYNGQMLEVGKSYKMAAKAPKNLSVFTNWTYGIGGSVATNTRTIKFVMQSNLVLTANFRSLLPPPGDALADRATDLSATPQTAIVVDGSSKDWMGVPRSSFSYASVTQEVAVALDKNNVALLLTGCPFSTSDNVLVYFKLRLSYGSADSGHTVDLWTSGSILYGMVDGKVIAGLKVVLLNGVLEVKLPVEQAPSQVTIEEVACGIDSGGGTVTELFKLTPP